MIYRNISLCMTVLFSVAACQQTAKKELDVTNNFVQVTSDNVSSLIGKKLSLGNDYIALSEDGALNGSWGGAPIAGTWEMRDGNWCRTLTVFKDPERLGIEDCQLWEIDGNSVRGTRNKGKGSTFTYKVSQ